jgi:serine/threonine protein kinase
VSDNIEVAGSLKPGQLIANNYRVTRPLGEGGFGAVYLGENTTLTQQKVVIKKLKGGERGAAAEEAKMMASLNHPNVVHVYAYDEANDCLVMEFLNGMSLVDYATTRGAKFDLLQAIRACEEVAIALRAIHGAGLVHRDIKPENVMVGDDLEWVKVIDMGTALRVGRTVNPPAGTAEFCPPEQFDGNIPASPANDNYALGVMLFNLVTKQLPFEGSPEELLKHHFYSEPPSLYERFKAGRTLEPEVDFVLEKADELVSELMNKDASKRPDARSVASQLSSLESKFANEKTQARAEAPIPLVAAIEVPGGIGVRRTSTTVLPKKTPGMVIVAPTTSEALASLEKPKKDRKWVYAALLLLLFGGWAVFGNSEKTEVTPTPEVKPEPLAVQPPAPAPVDAGAMVAKAEPIDDPDLSPLTEVKPNAKAEAKNPPPLVVKIPKTNIQIEKSPACTFDDRFREYARRMRGQLRELPGSDTALFLASDEKLVAALAAEDCRRANDALSGMRKLVDPE